MQRVARELNQAETAFLYTQQDGFNLRWFRPIVEMDLCGHADLLQPWQQAAYGFRHGGVKGVIRSRRDADAQIQGWGRQPCGGERGEELHAYVRVRVGPHQSLGTPVSTAAPGR